MINLDSYSRKQLQIVRFPSHEAGGGVCATNPKAQYVKGKGMSEQGCFEYMMDAIIWGLHFLLHRFQFPRPHPTNCSWVSEDDYGQVLDLRFM